MIRSRSVFIVFCLAGIGACGGKPATPAESPSPGVPASSASAFPASAGDAGGIPQAADAPASSQGSGGSGDPGADSGALAHRDRHEPGRGSADIRAIVVTHREDVRACFRSALAETPGISGDFVARWTIDPAGAVSALSVETPDGQPVDASFAACVGGVIRAIHFAPSKGGFETHTRYPFSFHAPRTTTTD